MSTTTKQPSAPFWKEWHGPIGNLPGTREDYVAVNAVDPVISYSAHAAHLWNGLRTSAQIFAARPDVQLRPAPTRDILVEMFKAKKLVVESLRAAVRLTEKKLADWTVRMVFDVERVVASDGNYVAGDMFLIDLWRAQLECPKVEAQFRTDILQWKPLFFSLEGIGDGGVIFQRFRADNLPVKRMKYGDNWTIPDKVTKATAAEVAMANCKVRFDQDAPWIETLETELLRFPNGQKDDQADCLAQACHITQGRDLWTPPPPEPDRPGTMGALAGHAEMLEEERRPPVDPFRRNRRA